MKDVRNIQPCPDVQASALHGMQNSLQTSFPTITPSWLDANSLYLAFTRIYTPKQIQQRIERLKQLANIIHENMQITRQKKGWRYEKLVK